MIRKVDRFFVCLAWLSFLALMFFDLLFQTSAIQNAEGTLIQSEFAMRTFLNPWQLVALHLVGASFVVSLIMIWILGVVMWAERRKKVTGSD
jgi:hypothetical protein